MAKKVLVILSEGFEEIEAIVPIDILRRAKVEVTIATPDKDLVVAGRNGVRITADQYLTKVNFEVFDALVLPGGPAAKVLKEREDILELVCGFHKKGKQIAAICAAPLILKNSGVLEGHRYTGYPGTQELAKMEEEKLVVKDRQLITSKSPGTAIEFALNIVADLVGEKTADKIKEDICFSYEY
jgi:4-methyl-5(b-hydroxyethyl)-thiazole monophosphate biosynthesis